MTLRPLKANTDGYVQIYLANESNLEVRFDEFEVSYAEPKVVQENAYSAWGNNLVGIETEGQPNDKRQYLGKEKQEELGLGWLDLQARFYDPALGRFHAVDPKPDIEEQESLTPYQYSLNNPIRYSDPDGKCATCPKVGSNPMYYLADNLGKYFQGFGTAIDKANLKVQAFFSFGGEQEGKSGTLKGNVSNETRTTITVGTTVKDFFTPTSGNKPVASSPLVLSVKTTNETKITVSGKVPVEGLEIHTKNVTSKNTSTGEVSNTTTVTLGRDQTGVFVETGTKGTAVGVRTEQKVAAPTGAFIKFGGSISVGNTNKSKAND